MSRMTMGECTLAAILSLCVWSSSTVEASDLVRFRLKNGETITGELLEPSSNGDYRVQVGDRIVVIGHDDVYTTIEVGGDQRVAPTIDRRPMSTNTKEVLRALQERLPLLKVPAESARMFRGCLAEATRGDWDFAIRTAERLLELEPTWVDPQILRAQLLSDRGQTDSAVALALWIESMAKKDVLALEVAATCYRRGSFTRRAAMTMDRVFDAEYPADRAQYERVANWWGVDPGVALEAWNAYVKRDPLLRNSWCAEGKVLHRAELSLARSDWEAARAAIDEMRAHYPWAQNEVQPIESRIVERRLRQSEAAGRVEEALIALETLQTTEADRGSEWTARRTALLEHHLRRGLAKTDFIALRAWATQSLGIFGDDAEASARISNRFQEVACGLAARSQIELAEHAFHEARRWDPMARPKTLPSLIDRVLVRVRDDVAMRRTLRVLRTAEILRDAYPEQREELLERLSDVCRDELRDVANADEISGRLAELRGLFLRRKAPSDLNGSDDGTAVASATADGAPAHDSLRLTAMAYPVLTRYFPHNVGDRWVYEIDGGRREEHEVTQLTPVDGGGWKIEFEIRADQNPKGFTRTVYLVDGDLRNGFATSPPGEVALRYPLSHGSKWNWEKGNLRFQRKLSRPQDPLILPGGTIEDYLVVEAVNTIQVGPERAFETWQRVYYGANVGIVKVESEDETLSRTLLEYHPAPESTASR